MASTNQMQPTLKHKQESEGPAPKAKDRPQKPAPLSTKQSKIARMGKWQAEQLDKPKKDWESFVPKVEVPEAYSEDSCRRHTGEIKR